jgi:hypothetical protein
MSNFKGTKGKWIFNEQDFKIRGTGDIEGMTVIANVSPKMNYSRGSGTQYANAKLIEAAPEMLLLLQKLSENNMCSVVADEWIQELLDKVMS